MTTESTTPMNFALPDDRGEIVRYDADSRELHNSVLVLYRGHW
jgi:hypothetical protein